MVKLRCFNWEYMPGGGCLGRRSGKRLYYELWFNKEDVTRVFKYEKDDYHYFYIGKHDYMTDDGALPGVLGVIE